MLVFDELKKNEPHLRLVAVGLAVGLCILLAGLWWVQVVSAREYQEHLTTQSFRTIRLPAVRGKILDREGRVLAENRPRYNLSLYLDDLHRQFDVAYGALLKSARVVQKQKIAAAEKRLDRSLTKTERKQFAFKPEYLTQLRELARVRVANNVAAGVSQKIGEPLAIDAAQFKRHYATRLALPFPVLKNLTPAQIARFQESYAGGLGADLDLQSVRNYPLGLTATHLLGYLTRDDNSYEGEESFYSYRLPDYRGVVGVEAGFDAQLRGRAGAESVLVNNLGYRQSENVWSQPEPGQNLVLTIDLDLQRAAEASLAKHQGLDARAAVVVMDVRNGDVLVLASSPAVNPNNFIAGFSAADSARLTDVKLRPQINRATQENYAPGSIFKVIIGLAALEAGLNPEKFYDVQADPTRTGRGCVYVGRRKIDDTAPPGEYNFKRAIVRSSNSYFIQTGLQTGVNRIIALAEKFQLGEKGSLPTRQETAGNLPSFERIREGWSDGDTANLCIGQGEVSVTPLQMAVVYSTIANGGAVYWPRLVSRIEPQDPLLHEVATNFPAGLVRDRLGVSGRNLRILHNAMLAETEDAEGTGQAAKVSGLRICGKTGTAQVMDEHNRVVDHTTWFASFAPYESPRYAVVVMVEGGSSGGGTCAPIAHDVYETILQKQTSVATKTLATAMN
ncbi:MAG: penicillin-binding transpeptidase domain-containing protein [Verrucomicrobiota bacterium]